MAAARLALAAVFIALAALALSIDVSRAAPPGLVQQCSQPAYRQAHLSECNLQSGAGIGIGGGRGDGGGLLGAIGRALGGLSGGLLFLVVPTKPELRQRRRDRQVPAIVHV